MKIQLFIETIKDIFLLNGFDNTNNSNNNKISSVITPIGYIIFGILLRSIIIMIITLTMIVKVKQYELNSFVMFILWFIGLYPAYKQYYNYKEYISTIKSKTICGQCKYFNEDSYLCILYDEHICINEEICKGEKWEIKIDN